MLLGTSTQATNGLRTSTKNTPSLGNDVRGVNEVCDYADTAAKKGPPGPATVFGTSAVIRLTRTWPSTPGTVNSA